MKTIMYEKDGNYVRRVGNEVEGYSEKVEDLIHDVARDTRVSNDFALELNKLIDSDILDFGNILDIMRFASSYSDELETLINYTGKFLDLFLFSDPIEINPAVIKDKFNRAVNGDIVGREAEVASKECSSVRSNTYFIDVIGYQFNAKENAANLANSK